MDAPRVKAGGPASASRKMGRAATSRRRMQPQQHHAPAGQALTQVGAGGCIRHLAAHAPQVQAGAAVAAGCDEQPAVEGRVAEEGCCHPCMGGVLSSLQT